MTTCDKWTTTFKDSFINTEGWYLEIWPSEHLQIEENSARGQLVSTGRSLERSIYFNSYLSSEWEEWQKPICL